MTLLLAGSIWLCAGAAEAQTGAPPPTSPHSSGTGAAALGSVASAAPGEAPPWDASTFKPASHDAMGSMLMFTPDGIKITNVPLAMVVREAFAVQDDRIFGLPGWAKTSMFDIEAKVAPEDAPKLKGMKFDQRRTMMISLLVERCGLKYHHETRDLPVYNLVIAKGGSKLTASKADAPAADGGGKRGNHMLMMHGRGHLESTATDLDSLSRVLSQQLGRTVVNRTGLTGNFDYKLDWTPDDALPAMAKNGDAMTSGSAPATDNAGPSIFTAIEEQLGLKLEAAKGPADVVVIDALEQPSAN